MDNEIVIIDGARTAFGTFGGTLRDVEATDLAIISAKEALRRSNVEAGMIDAVVVGNVIQSTGATAYIARHMALAVGVPMETPALVVNRLCGSGLQAVVTAAQWLLLGEAQWVLAGGAESMSTAPYVVKGARWGLGLDGGKLEDALWHALVDPYRKTPMAITAENVAAKYGLSRQEVDEFAYTSQMRAKAATESGRLREEIVPVPLPGKGGQAIVFDRDEHIRGDTTLESLAKLKARFKEGGVVTAGNASGINDGAGMMVITTRANAKERGLKPLGRVLSWSTVGVDPDIMGMGPAAAIPLALKRAGLRQDQMDLFEVNEAFASQYLGVEKELGLDRSKTNVNGGAVAIGHPLAASGARLAITTLYELRHRGGRYGVASLCIGGGQGIAAVLENLQ
ncbi:MAG: acetyl-CoA C-acetyltransferase [Dehalococcoidia bacterium]|nr:acetyl-CoA C-acetyltransferase [Dehalococcoidia bacterium]